MPFDDPREKFKELSDINYDLGEYYHAIGKPLQSCESYHNSL